METKTQMRLVLAEDIKSKLVELAKKDRRSQTKMVEALIEEEYNRRIISNQLSTAG